MQVPKILTKDYEKLYSRQHLKKNIGKQEIYNFLRNHRSTPHTNTDKSPADLMFPGRNYRTRIPEIKKNVITTKK